MMAEPNGLAHYQALPYTRAVEPRADSDGRAYFLARIVEIPGIRIHGSTREEALARLHESFEDIIQDLIESGEEIPEPAQWPDNMIVKRRRLPKIRRRRGTASTDAADVQDVAEIRATDDDHLQGAIFNTVRTEALVGSAR